LWKLVRVDNKN